jgi:hypothetical protein
MDFESNYSDEETEEEIEESPDPSVSFQSQAEARDLKLYESEEKRRIAEMFGQPNKWHEGTPFLDLVEDEELARMRGCGFSRSGSVAGNANVDLFPRFD